MAEGLKNPTVAKSLLRLRCLTHSEADVDEVVGDDAKADPALHSSRSLVAATAEAVSPFDDADAPLASGAPLGSSALQAFVVIAPQYSLANVDPVG
jgi:hypothetical protein